MGIASHKESKGCVNEMTPQEELVHQTIAKHKVVIFSKTQCPYCKMAKEQFQKLSVPVHTIELDNRNDGSEIQEALGKITGGKTVPRCFIDGKFVGGGTDVKKMYECGQLQKIFS